MAVIFRLAASVILNIFLIGLRLKIRFAQTKMMIIYESEK